MLGFCAHSFGPCLQWRHNGWATIFGVGLGFLLACCFKQVSVLLLECLVPPNSPQRDFSMEAPFGIEWPFLFKAESAFADSWLMSLQVWGSQGLLSCSAGNLIVLWVLSTSTFSINLSYEISQYLCSWMLLQQVFVVSYNLFLKAINLFVFFF